MANDPGRLKGNLVVENFGQVASKPATITIQRSRDERQPVILATADVPPLEPYAQTEVAVEIEPGQPGGEQELIIEIHSGATTFPALTARVQLP